MSAELVSQGQGSFIDRLSKDKPGPDDGFVYLRPGSSNFCGRSILVGKDQEATLGGILLINDIYYGFTTLHHGVHQKGSVESLIANNDELTFDDDGDITSTGKRAEWSKIIHSKTYSVFVT